MADLCSLLAKLDAMTRVGVKAQERGLPPHFLRDLFLSHKNFQCKERKEKNGYVRVFQAKTQIFRVNIKTEVLCLI